MFRRRAQAIWEGNLREGKGSLALASGSLTSSYSFGSRFGDASGTNPEELIGAAHAGCFSMALSHSLAEAGFLPRRVETEAEVQLEKLSESFRITAIYLKTRAQVPDLTEALFLEHAQAASQNCPVSRALAGTKINLQASLIK